jgi:hypothetical protein
MMRSSFSQCAGAIVLAAMVSGCASGKWPWQGGNPFSSASTPSTTTPAGATKPAALASNTPPSSVTAPTVTYPTYQGSAAGMNAGNNFAPNYQPTTPMTDNSAAAYTANSNNAAGRTGGFVAPQQGAYPTNTTIPSNTNPSTGTYGNAPASVSYNATPSPGTYTGTPASTGYGAAPSSGYGAAPNAGYGATPNAGYGPTAGASGAAQPTLPYGGTPAGVQPNTSSYPRDASATNATANPPASAGSMTGTNNAAAWNGSSGNPARPATPPASGDRYGASSDRYGDSSGDRYGAAGNSTPPATTPDPRYGGAPAASTPDPRSAPPTDYNYGDRYGATSTPAATSGGTTMTVTNNDAGVSIPSAGTSTGTTGAAGGYQPGSVSAYDPANKPSVLTASNPANTTR